MQIVVGKELKGDEFVTLRVQGSNANEEDIKQFIRLAGLLKDSDEKDAYDEIMQISMTENEEAYNSLKEDDGNMCEALERLMEDVIVARENAKVTAVSEKNATLMLMDSEPLSKIKKYTGVSESRIRELAAAAGLTVVN